MRRCLIAVFIIVLCSCTTSGDPGATGPSGVGSRCEPASGAQVQTLRSAIQDEQARNGIENVYAVRSKDFQRVWMVAGGITGDGIKAGQAIGVWAMNGEKDSPGLTFSVNYMAKEFSGFGLGSGTKAAITMNDDGAKEAEACARNK